MTVKSTRITQGYYRVVGSDGQTYTVQNSTNGWVTTSPDGTSNSSWPLPTKRWAMTLIPGG